MTFPRVGLAVLALTLACGPQSARDAGTPSAMPDTTPDRADTGLEHNRWVPTHLGERAVTVASGQREPWFVLEPRSMQVTGSGGCNRFSGSYGAGRDTLRFGRLTSTLMLCDDGGIETEFFRVLDETRRYRVQGRTLELLDDRGRSLARLEERTLR
jgi:heat shock protein HslJ